MRETSTVKRVDIFGAVHDTFQTEAELNGWRASQAPLFTLPDAPKPAPRGQEKLL